MARRHRRIEPYSNNRSSKIFLYNDNRVQKKKREKKTEKEEKRKELTRKRE